MDNFPNEKPETLPFMFRFGEAVNGNENREAGRQSEYWTEQYKTNDTD